MRRALLAIGTAVVLAPAAGCVDATSRSAPDSAATATAETAAQCAARRPPYGDVFFVWFNSIGGPRVTRLPGGWVFNEATGACQTTVEYQLSRTPTGPGNCAQIAPVADNPGYDVNADPLPPLNNLGGMFGNCSIATQTNLPGRPRLQPNLGPATPTSTASPATGTAPSPSATPSLP